MNKWTLKMQVKLKEQIRLMLTSRSRLSLEALSPEAAEKVNYLSCQLPLLMKSRKMALYHQYIPIEVIGLLDSETRADVDSHLEREEKVEESRT